MFGSLNKVLCMNSRAVSVYIVPHMDEMIDTVVVK